MKLEIMPFTKLTARPSSLVSLQTACQEVDGTGRSPLDVERPPHTAGSSRETAARRADGRNGNPEHLRRYDPVRYTRAFR
jgi:hypothetical protein